MRTARHPEANGEPRGLPRRGASATGRSAEGWLVRSLYRDDKLSQPEIARRLDRHKSWVCRQLVLVEALDLAVQADVRLGLLVPRAAIALAALPRGNQVPASAVVIRRGLTVRQTERLIAMHALRIDIDGPSYRQHVAHERAAGRDGKLAQRAPRRDADRG